MRVCVLKREGKKEREKKREERENLIKREEKGK